MKMKVRVELYSGEQTAYNTWRIDQIIDLGEMTFSKAAEICDAISKLIEATKA